MTDETTSSNGDNYPQPLGLIPLYPFPQIDNHGNRNNRKSHQFGMSPFLPPIYQYGKSAQFPNDIGPSLVVEALIIEVLREEILDLFREVLIDGVDPTQESIQLAAKIYAQTLSRIALELTNKIIDETVERETQLIVEGYFDGLINDHHTKLNTDFFSKALLDELLTEIVITDVAEDVLLSCACGESIFSIIHEVLLEESNAIAIETLNHYGAGIAFESYRKISKFAVDHVLDRMCFEVLLPASADNKDELNHVLDHIMFDVLLHKQLELSPVSDCMPMQWFLKKSVVDLSLDLVLDELCDKLDDAFVS